MLLGEPGRVPFRGPERAEHIPVHRHRLRGLGRSARHMLAQHLPIPVRGVEVAPPLGPAALTVDGGVQVGPAGGAPVGIRLLPRQSDGLRALPGQSGLPLGQRAYAGDQPGIEPRLAGEGKLGVQGEPLAQGEPGGLAEAGELLDLWPGPLRVHMVRGERGDAAPVVDPGREQQRQLGRLGKVRRRLDEITLSARPVSQATLDRATIDRYASLGVKLLIADTSFEHNSLQGVLDEVSQLADQLMPFAD
jgi:hypothetical protein